MVDVKDYLKPPFANYDIVVYFGCGVFSLPLIFHYFIEPLGLRFPKFQFNIGVEFADATISTLSLLFTVYILGHMIAYVASHVIEKSVDLFFGKISTALIISDLTSKENFSENIQSWMYSRFLDAFRRPHFISSSIRIVVFTPVFPTLLFVFLFRQTEYFRSRVPPKVFAQVRRECSRRGFDRVGLRTKWFKAIEHDVINNDTFALGRMYNYLLIGGIFRSLSLIFLGCAWAESYFIAHTFVDGHQMVNSLMSDNKLKNGPLLTLLLFNVLFGFSLSAYLKFARRYVEEAVFSFVLTK